MSEIFIYDGSKPSRSRSFTCGEIDPNNVQIGGDHYKTDYQTWDFICDMRLHFLPANAVKYISRWRTKNGIQDLEKAIHYLQKAKTIKMTVVIDDTTIDRFCSQFGYFDEKIIRSIVNLRFDSAIDKIRALIVRYTEDK